MKFSISTTSAIIVASWIFFRMSAEVCLAQEQTINSTIIYYGETWKLWKGSISPSPAIDGWREPEWNDSNWLDARLPVHYGEPAINGTLLNDMRHSYTSLFFRKQFTVESPESVEKIILEAEIDDGVALWINGVPLYRYNTPSGGIKHTDTAPSTVEITRIRWVAEASQFNLKKNGNLISAVILNTTLTSSDIYFNIQLSAENRDSSPPYITSSSPAHLQSVLQLNQLTVNFNEPVIGLSASDLLINGQEAESVQHVPMTTSYRFTFSDQPPGRIEVSWSGDAAISDASGNFFSPTSESNFIQVTVLNPLVPRLVQNFPSPGSTVSELTHLLITFSIPVTAMTSETILFNNIPSTSAVSIDSSSTRFSLSAPPDLSGLITIQFSPDHQITDLATQSTKPDFPAWTIHVDPNQASYAHHVVINEFSTHAESALTSDLGFPSDWIEITNQSQHTISLNGWGLTDDMSQPFQWIFPDISLQPMDFLIVMASGLNQRLPGSELHTNFKLNSQGEYLGLFPPDIPAKPTISWPDKYPPQSNGLTYGLHPDGEESYFHQPTPGQPNSSSTKIIGILTPPTISLKSGYIENSTINISLSHPMQETTIRYTLDGSEPGLQNGTIYTNQPISISGRDEKPGVALRAKAFRQSYLSSHESVATWIFTNNMLKQSSSPDGLPTQWGGSPSTRADYEMDKSITQSPEYQSEILSALNELPTMAISIPHSDLFSPTTGIYANASKSGLAWEKPVHMEWIEPDGTSLAAAHCGMRIQGGSSTTNWKSKKLSLRLLFKSEYGPERLEALIFPDSPVRRFNTLVLDAHLNLVFIHPDHNQRRRSQYIRDAFMSHLLLEAGHAATHHRFCHLYLNGLYWGLYDVHERPDAAFAASYFGGKDDHYDAIRHGATNTADGTSTAWNQILSQSRIPNLPGESWNSPAGSVDLKNLADYIIFNMYAGNDDWAHHNWYINANLNEGIPFHFISWDAEHVLKSVDIDITNRQNPGSPAELFHNLLSQKEFKILLSDRIHHHFKMSGILSSKWIESEPDGFPWTRSRAAQLYLDVYKSVHNSLLLESARWGDTHDNPGRPGRPYERDVEVRNELNWLMETYFPSRAQRVQGQFTDRNWLSPLEMPSLNIPSGRYPSGMIIQALPSQHSLYFTSDGTDPRNPDSSISKNASFGNLNIPLKNYIHIQARHYSNGVWSSLLSEVFQEISLDSPIRITEIHYHPIETSPYPEFLELYNVGESPVNLGNMHFKGLDLIFDQSIILPPRQPKLLIPIGESFNVPALDSQVLTFYQGKLDNGGELLNLVNFKNNSMAKIEYDDKSPWPETADGHGHSLQLIPPFIQSSVRLPEAWIPASPTPGELNHFTSINKITYTPQDTILQIDLKNPPGLIIAILSSSDLDHWTIEDYQAEAPENTSFLIPLDRQPLEKFFRTQITTP